MLDHFLSNSRFSHGCVGVILSNFQCWCPSHLHIFFFFFEIFSLCCLEKLFSSFQGWFPSHLCFFFVLEHSLFNSRWSPYHHHLLFFFFFKKKELSWSTLSQTLVDALPINSLSFCIFYFWLFCFTFSNFKFREEFFLLCNSLNLQYFCKFLLLTFFYAYIIRLSFVNVIIGLLGRIYSSYPPSSSRNSWSSIGIVNALIPIWRKIFYLLTRIFFNLTNSIYFMLFVSLVLFIFIKVKTKLN